VAIVLDAGIDHILEDLIKKGLLGLLSAPTLNYLPRLVEVLLILIISQLNRRGALGLQGSFVAFGFVVCLNLGRRMGNLRLPINGFPILFLLFIVPRMGLGSTNRDLDLWG
jgi:hypothetical protein